MSSVGSFFSYVNDARSLEPEIKMALREIRLRMSDLDSVGSGWNSKVCFYERGNEISGHIKSGLFVHYLRWRESPKALRH